MRAMVFTRPGVVEMLDVDATTPVQGEVLVEVAACGICGSELHGISKPGFREPPLVMGHEFVGTTGDGRRVVANPIVFCGSCDMCESGHEQLCRSRSIIGIHRAGAFTEQVAVPGKLLHDLPDTLSWEQGAMIEPLANALHAWRLSGASGTERVGVIGAGTIGLVCQIVAKYHGAEVTTVDLAQDRLGFAQDLGADHTGTELNGEFDVVFDAVGGAATHRASLEHLKPSGTTIWLGLLSPEAGFDAQAVIRQEQTVRGSFAYTNRDFKDAVALAPKVELGWGTPFSLEQGASIFTELMNGRSDVVKALLCP